MRRPSNLAGGVRAVYRVRRQRSDDLQTVSDARVRQDPRVAGSGLLQNTRVAAVRRNNSLVVRGGDLGSGWVYVGDKCIPWEQL